MKPWPSLGYDLPCPRRRQRASRSAFRAEFGDIPASTNRCIGSTDALHRVGSFGLVSVTGYIILGGVLRSYELKIGRRGQFCICPQSRRRICIRTQFVHDAARSRHAAKRWTRMRVQGKMRVTSYIVSIGGQFARNHGLIRFSARCPWRIHQPEGAYRVGRKPTAR